MNVKCLILTVISLLLFTAPFSFIREYISLPSYIPFSTIAHIIIFGFLTLIFPSQRNYIILLYFCAFSFELIQLLTPYRFFSIKDLITNVTTVTLTLIIKYICTRKTT